MEQDSGWTKDLPFLVVSCMAYAVLLAKNPALYWGLGAPKSEAPISVEFVQALPPPPAPALAVVAQGGPKDKAPGPGLRPLALEDVKKGSPRGDKKTDAKLRRSRFARKRPAVDPEKARAMREAAERRRQNALARAEEVRAEREEARERARQAAEVRAAEARERAERLAEERAERERSRRETALARAEELRRKREEARERARQLAEIRAAEARERALRLAERRAAEARRRAEIQEQLASISSPDEEISNVSAGARDRPARTAGEEGAAALAGDMPARTAEVEKAAAALADAADPVYDLEGREGRDALNWKPAGAGGAAGGSGERGGGPVSWSLEGPVGSRKLLKRRLPGCPDWVSAKGLDLAVQLKFQVLEDGTVKPGVVVKKTSGFPDLDGLAIEALRRWRFQPLSSSVGMRTPDIWGIVSFKFVAG